MGSYVMDTLFFSSSGALILGWYIETILMRLSRDRMGSREQDYFTYNQFSIRPSTSSSMIGVGRNKLKEIE